jgi:hypothetical protein
MRGTGASYPTTPGSVVPTSRSNRPWQSLERHVELMGTLLEELDLRDMTQALHDWGGPIGLTLALAIRIGSRVL